MNKNQQKTHLLSLYWSHTFYICILLLISTLMDITLEASTTNFTYETPILWGAHYVSMTQINPNFTNAGGPYTYSLSFGKTYTNVKYLNTALNGYKSQVSGYFGYRVSSQINSDPGSMVSINLTILTHSQFSYFSFSVLIISQPLDMYITMMDYTFTNLSSPQYIPSPVTNLSTTSFQVYNFISNMQIQFYFNHWCHDIDYLGSCYWLYDCTNGCLDQQGIVFSLSIKNSTYLKATKSSQYSMNFTNIDMFILLINFNDLHYNSPFNTMSYNSVVNRYLTNNEPFYAICINNSNLYSPNYDVKCLIGFSEIQAFFPKPLSKFNLTSTGITNFQTQYYLSDDGRIYTNKFYTTICWRMVLCPEMLPFYNFTSNSCNDCSAYAVLNETLPQYCEELYSSSSNGSYYFNYTTSLVYTCKKCLVCSNLSYIEAEKCYKCDTKYPFCVYCNQTVCNLCDDSHYVDENVNYSCIYCGIPIKECISCTNTSICRQCKTPQYFVNEFGKCQCIVGWNVTDTCTTIIGCVSSHKINNVTLCLACDSRRNFKYIRNNCECKYGYSLAQNKSQLQDSSCQQTCGDGILINDECDDGNLFNGDGCSDNCIIEPGFKCYGGSLSSKSICGYQARFYLSIYSILRTFGENTGLIKVKISPNLKNLKQIKWIDYVTSQTNNSSQITLSILSANYDQNLGNLEILFNLNETVQKNRTNLYICYDSDQFSTNCNSIDFELRGMNAPLTCEDFLQHHKILIILSHVMSIMCLCVSILSFFKFSYIGMENILTFMTIYYCRLLNQNKNASLMYVLYPLRYAQGFNDILIDQGRDYHLSPTASRYHLSGETLININISLVFLLVFLIIYGVFFIQKTRLKFQFESQIQGKIVSTKVYQVLIPAYEKIQNFQHNYLYPFMLLSIYLIYSTFGKWLFVTKNYSYYLQDSVWNAVFSIFLIAGFITIYFYIREVSQILKTDDQNNDFHQVNCKTLEGRVDQDYSGFATIFYLFSTIFLISSWEYDTQTSTFGYYDLYIYLGMSSLYLFFVIYLRPYTSGFIHNFGVIYNQSVIVIFVSFLTFIKYFMSFLSIIHVICLYILLILLFGTNLIGIFRIYAQWYFASKSQGQKKRQQQNFKSNMIPQTWKQKKKKYKIENNPYYYSPEQVEHEKNEKIERENEEKSSLIKRQLPEQPMNNKSLEQYKAQLRASLLKQRGEEFKKANKKPN